MNQLNYGHMQQHVCKTGQISLVSFDKSHLDPYKACTVDSQGHLIHHIPRSSSKIFDQEGYSIIFPPWDPQMEAALPLQKKWVMTGVRRGGDVWQTHFASVSFADNMNSLQALQPMI